MTIVIRFLEKIIMIMISCIAFREPQCDNSDSVFREDNNDYVFVGLISTSLNVTIVFEFFEKGDNQDYSIEQHLTSNV